MRIYKDAQSMGFYAEQDLNGVKLFGWGFTMKEAIDRLFKKINFSLK